MQSTKLFEPFRSHSLAIWVIAGTLLIPAILAVLVFPSPMGDLREQIAWGRHFPLVTPRHPPMMVWTSGIVDLLFGPGMVPQMVASQMLLLVGILYVWAILRLVTDEAGRFLFTFLYATSLCFSIMSLSWAMNADLLQVTSWPAVVFHFLRAARSNRWLDWIALAAFSVMAVLTKYTSILLFAAMIAAILAIPSFRQTLRRRRLYLAALGAMMLLIPHGVALMHNSAAIGFGLRLFQMSDSPGDVALSLASLVGGYLDTLFPAWLVIAVGIVFGVFVFRRFPTAAELPDAARLVVALNAALIGFTTLLILFGGLTYLSRFDAPFAALAVPAVAPFVGWRAQPQAFGERTIVIGVGLFNLALAAAGVVAYTFFTAHAPLQEPVKQPTSLILGDWASRYSCGPAWVIGHRRAAQLVGLHTPGASTMALDDLKRGPSWFDREDFRNRGAILIYYDPIPDDILQPILPEASLTAERMFSALLQRTRTGAALTYHYRFLPPAKCPD